MRLALALATLAAVGLTQTSDAQAENWNDHFSISAKSSGGELTISVTPKSGWYVNTEYPMKIKLEGGTCEKSELKKSDARFEGTEKKGKAKRASFSVKCEGDVKGAYKLVICSDDNCSPPIKGDFRPS